MPTFEQAIACFLELGLGCNVEIKPCEGREAETARVTVETLRRCWPAALPAPLLSSFKDESLKAAQAAAPEFARALLVSELGEDWRARAEAVGAVGMNVGRRKLTPKAPLAVKRAGYVLVGLDGQRSGRGAGDRRHGGGLHHHRRARRDPARAGLDLSAQIWGLRRGTVLSGL